MMWRADIEEADQRIDGYARRTPVMPVEQHAWGIDARLILKLEQFQHAGSFKPRGAFNRILAHAVPETGIIAASGGSHGLGVAYAAQQLGYRAEIFVPESCPLIKVERLRHYGGEVKLVGANYAEALAACEVQAAQTGALMVHAYDQLEGVAGQGTMGRELAKQVPDLDTLLVAVGRGGLIAVIAPWFSFSVPFIAVSPHPSPPTYHPPQSS